MRQLARLAVSMEMVKAIICLMDGPLMCLGGPDDGDLRHVWIRTEASGPWIGDVSFKGFT